VNPSADALGRNDRAASSRPFGDLVIGPSNRVCRDEKAQGFRLRMASGSHHTPCWAWCGKLALALHRGINL